MEKDKASVKIRESIAPANIEVSSPAGKRMAWAQVLELAGQEKFELSEESVELLSSMAKMPKEEFRGAFRLYQLGKSRDYANTMSENIAAYLSEQGGREVLGKKLEKDISSLVSGISSAMNRQKPMLGKNERQELEKFLSALEESKSASESYWIISRSLSGLSQRLKSLLHYCLEISGSGLVFPERGGYILVNIPRLELYINSPEGDGISPLGFYADRPVYNYILKAGAAKDDGRIALFNSFAEEMFSGAERIPLGPFESMSLAGRPAAADIYQSKAGKGSVAFSPKFAKQVAEIGGKYPDWEMIAYLSFPPHPATEKEYSEFTRRFTDSISRRLMSIAKSKGRKLPEKEAEEDACAIVAKVSLGMLDNFIAPQSKPFSWQPWGAEKPVAQEKATGKKSAKK